MADQASSAMREQLNRAAVFSLKGFLSKASLAPSQNETAAALHVDGAGLSSPYTRGVPNGLASPLTSIRENGNGGGGRVVAFATSAHDGGPHGSPLSGLQSPLPPTPAASPPVIEPKFRMAPPPPAFQMAVQLRGLLQKKAALTSQLWSLQNKSMPQERQYKKLQEPGRRRGHWDNVLEEAVWSATDVHHERRWKLVVAAALAAECRWAVETGTLPWLLRRRAEDVVSVEVAAESAAAGTALGGDARAADRRLLSAAASVTAHAMLHPIASDAAAAPSPSGAARISASRGGGGGRAGGDNNDREVLAVGDVRGMDSHGLLLAARAAKAVAAVSLVHSLNSDANVAGAAEKSALLVWRTLQRLVFASLSAYGRVMPHSADASSSSNGGGDAGAIQRDGGSTLLSDVSTLSMFRPAPSSSELQPPSSDAAADDAMAASSPSRILSMNPRHLAALSSALNAYSSLWIGAVEDAAASAEYTHAGSQPLTWRPRRSLRRPQHALASALLSLWGTGAPALIDGCALRGSLGRSSAIATALAARHAAHIAQSQFVSTTRRHGSAPGAGSNSGNSISSSSSSLPAPASLIICDVLYVQRWERTLSTWCPRSHVCVVGRAAVVAIDHERSYQQPSLFIVSAQDVLSAGGTSMLSAALHRDDSRSSSSAVGADSMAIDGASAATTAPLPPLASLVIDMRGVGVSTALLSARGDGGDTSGSDVRPRFAAAAATTTTASIAECMVALLGAVQQLPHSILSPTSTARLVVSGVPVLDPSAAAEALAGARREAAAAGAGQSSSSRGGGESVSLRALSGGAAGSSSPSGAVGAAAPATSQLHPLLQSQHHKLLLASSSSSTSSPVGRSVSTDSASLRASDGDAAALGSGASDHHSWWSSDPVPASSRYSYYGALASFMVPGAFHSGATAVQAWAAAVSSEAPAAAAAASAATAAAAPSPVSPSGGVATTSLLLGASHSSASAKAKGGRALACLSAMFSLPLPATTQLQHSSVESALGSPTGVKPLPRWERRVQVPLTKMQVIASAKAIIAYDVAAKAALAAAAAASEHTTPATATTGPPVKIARLDSAFLNAASGSSGSLPPTTSSPALLNSTTSTSETPASSPATPSTAAAAASAPGPTLSSTTLSGGGGSSTAVVTLMRRALGLRHVNTIGLTRAAEASAAAAAAATSSRSAAAGLSPSDAAHALSSAANVSRLAALLNLQAVAQHAKAPNAAWATRQQLRSLHHHQQPFADSDAAAEGEDMLPCVWSAGLCCESFPATLEMQTVVSSAMDVPLSILNIRRGAVASSPAFLCASVEEEEEEFVAAASSPSAVLSRVRLMRAALGGSEGSGTTLNQVIATRSRRVAQNQTGGSSDASAAAAGAAVPRARPGLPSVIELGGSIRPFAVHTRECTPTDVTLRHPNPLNGTVSSGRQQQQRRNGSVAVRVHHQHQHSSGSGVEGIAAAEAPAPLWLLYPDPGECVLFGANEKLARNNVDSKLTLHPSAAAPAAAAASVDSAATSTAGSASFGYRPRTLQSGAVMQQLLGATRAPRSRFLVEGSPPQCLLAAVSRVVACLPPVQASSARKSSLLSAAAAARASTSSAAAAAGAAASASSSLSQKNASSGAVFRLETSGWFEAASSPRTDVATPLARRSIISSSVGSGSPTRSRPMLDAPFMCRQSGKLAALCTLIEEMSTLGKRALFVAHEPFLADLAVCLLDALRFPVVRIDELPAASAPAAASVLSSSSSAMSSLLSSSSAAAAAVRTVASAAPSPIFSRSAVDRFNALTSSRGRVAAVACVGMPIPALTAVWNAAESARASGGRSHSSSSSIGGGAASAVPGEGGDASAAVLHAVVDAIIGPDIDALGVDVVVVLDAPPAAGSPLFAAVEAALLHRLAGQRATGAAVAAVVSAAPRSGGKSSGSSAGAAGGALGASSVAAPFPSSSSLAAAGSLLTVLRLSSAMSLETDSAYAASSSAAAAPSATTATSAPTSGASNTPATGSAAPGGVRGGIGARGPQNTAPGAVPLTQQTQASPLLTYAQRLTGMALEGVEGEVLRVFRAAVASSSSPHSGGSDTAAAAAAGATVSFLDDLRCARSAEEGASSRSRVALDALPYAPAAAPHHRANRRRSGGSSVLVASSARSARPDALLALALASARRRVALSLSGPTAPVLAATSYAIRTDDRVSEEELAEFLAPPSNSTSGGPGRHASGAAAAAAAAAESAQLAKNKRLMGTLLAAVGVITTHQDAGGLHFSHTFGPMHAESRLLHVPPSLAADPSSTAAARNMVAMLERPAPPAVAERPGPRPLAPKHDRRTELPGSLPALGATLTSAHAENYGGSGALAGGGGSPTGSSSMYPGGPLGAGLPLQRGGTAAAMAAAGSGGGGAGAASAGRAGGGGGISAATASTLARHGIMLNAGGGGPISGAGSPSSASAGGDGSSAHGLGAGGGGGGAHHSARRALERRAALGFLGLGADGTPPLPPLEGAAHAHLTGKGRDGAARHPLHPLLAQASSQQQQHGTAQLHAYNSPLHRSAADLAGLLLSSSACVTASAAATAILQSTLGGMKPLVNAEKRAGANKRKRDAAAAAAVVAAAAAAVAAATTAPITATTAVAPPPADSAGASSADASASSSASSDSSAPPKAAADGSSSAPGASSSDAAAAAGTAAAAAVGVGTAAPLPSTTVVVPSTTGVVDAGGAVLEASAAAAAADTPVTITTAPITSPPPTAAAASGVAPPSPPSSSPPTTAAATSDDDAAYTAPDVEGALSPAAVASIAQRALVLIEHRKAFIAAREAAAAKRAHALTELRAPSAVASTQQDLAFDRAGVLLDPRRCGSTAAMLARVRAVLTATSLSTAVATPVRAKMETSGPTGLAILPPVGARTAASVATAADPFVTLPGAPPAASDDGKSGSTLVEWSPEEDILLLRSVVEFGANWDLVRELIRGPVLSSLVRPRVPVPALVCPPRFRPLRSARACYDRFRRIISRSLQVIATWSTPGDVPASNLAPHLQVTRTCRLYSHVVTPAAKRCRLAAQAVGMFRNGARARASSSSSSAAAPVPSPFRAVDVLLSAGDALAASLPRPKRIREAATLTHAVMGLRPHLHIARVVDSDPSAPIAPMHDSHGKLYSEAGSRLAEQFARADRGDGGGGDRSPAPAAIESSSPQASSTSASGSSSGGGSSSSGAYRQMRAASLRFGGLSPGLLFPHVPISRMLPGAVPLPEGTPAVASAYTPRAEPFRHVSQYIVSLRAKDRERAAMAAAIQARQQQERNAFIQRQQAQQAAQQAQLLAMQQAQAQQAAAAAQAQAAAESDAAANAASRRNAVMEAIINQIVSLPAMTQQTGLSVDQVRQLLPQLLDDTALAQITQIAGHQMEGVIMSIFTSRLAGLVGGGAAAAPAAVPANGTAESSQPAGGDQQDHQNQAPQQK